MKQRIQQTTLYDVSAASVLWSNNGNAGEMARVGGGWA